MDWRGAYFDGRTAIRHPVVIRTMRTGLELTFEDGTTAWWPLAETRLAQGRYAGEQVRLERGGDLPAVLVLADPAFLTELHKAAPEWSGKFHDPGHRRLRVRLTVLAAIAVPVLAVAFYAWGIPALAAVSARVVPVTWEEALGEQTAANLAPPARRCVQPAAQRAIDGIVSRLILERPSPYTFRVIVVDDRIVNAFAAPGGYVIVMRGLLERTRSAEELAGVLAHELQHVLQRHSTRLIIQHASTGLLIAALAGDATGAVAYGVQSARVLAELRYNRQFEDEADAHGIAMLRDARIDPRGTIDFFERLLADEQDQPRPLTYLSTHPAARDRIERLRTLAAAGAGPSRPLLPDVDWNAVRTMCAARRGA